MSTPGRKSEVVQRVDEMKPGVTCKLRAGVGKGFPPPSSLQNEEHGERLAGQRRNAGESLACGLILMELMKTACAPGEWTCPWHRLWRDPEQQ